MAYNLTITFRGLFLFVPDPNRPLLHVLLPRTQMLGAEHQHYPTWGREGEKGRSFENIFVDLTAVPPAATTAVLPNSIADVTPHNDCVITTDHVTDSVHRNLIASIRLPVPADVAPGPTAIWQLAGKNRYLTHQVECMWADLALPSLKMTLWNRNRTSEILELPPIEDGWSLFFDHLPEHDHKLQKGQPAAYYTVCGSNKVAPLPHLKQTPPERAASTFTCMLGQGSLGAG